MPLGVIVMLHAYQLGIGAPRLFAFCLIHIVHNCRLMNIMTPT